MSNVHANRQALPEKALPEKALLAKMRLPD